MSRKDTSGTSKASTESARRKTPEPEDIGELGEDFFERARVRRGGKVVREASGTFAHRGRPPKKEGQRKEAVSIRLSPEVVRHFRGTGEGWQTRIDDALRQIVREAGAPYSAQGPGADPAHPPSSKPGAVRKGRAGQAKKSA